MAKAHKVLPAVADKTSLSKAMKMTLASLHLENITLSPKTIADLQLFEAGKLSKKEAIARVLARVKK